MKFDLRKNNIVTEQDAIEFLDFIVERAPQLKEVFKKQKFQMAAMKNRLAFKDSEIERASTKVVPTVDVEQSVTTDNVSAEVKDEAAERLAQLKAAVKPGEIGHLEVKREVEEVVDETSAKPEEEKKDPEVSKVSAEDTETAASKVAKAQAKGKKK